MPKKKPTKTKHRAVAKPVAENHPESPDSSPPKMGAPRKEIDYDAFESLCQMHATEAEICWHFKVDIDTLNARVKERYGKTFSDVYPTLSVGGRMSLRRQLWMMAMGSDAQYDPRTGEKLREAVKANPETVRFLSKQPEARGGLGMKESVENTLDLGDGSYEKLMGLAQKLEEKKRNER